MPQCRNPFLRMTDKTIALTKDDDYDDDDGDIYQINALREFSLSGHSTQNHLTKNGNHRSSTLESILGPFMKRGFKQFLFFVAYGITMALSYSSICWKFV